MTAPAPVILSRTVSLDGDWQLATDPTNQGLRERWWSAPLEDSVAAQVPWIIQDAFPGYHGIAWYQRELVPPENAHRGGRCLLRFWAVDYKADVWLDDKLVGSHEGPETPFGFDVTGIAKPGVPSRLTVRVLNPTNEPIDGMTLKSTPHRAKVIPYSAGASYNSGGIVDSVELELVPRAHLGDLWARPDPRTGAIRVEMDARNAANRPVSAQLMVSAAPATGGKTIDVSAALCTLPPGASTLSAELRVPSPHLWEPADPFLYRVTARLAVGRSIDERSVRCGFRDFRFENGFFRLNGRRLFVRGSHTVTAAPVGQHLAGDPELFQRDILTMKTMGFNCIRFIWGGSTRRQLDLCDEMGLLVYQESSASNPMEMSPQMAQRFDRSMAELIRRDRNHPCIVFWGLLNEAPDGPVFRHAVGMLPLVRSLDPDRVVMLNSGRWDGQLEIGTLSNPGAKTWETVLGAEGKRAGVTRAGVYGGYYSNVGDAHVYPPVPQTQEATRFLHELGHDTMHVFLTEYGIGSAVDLWRIVRNFERIGKPEAEDARYYRERLERFLEDWRRWHLAGVFANPADFFMQSARRSASQRTLGLDAIRSNPNLVGYSLTGMVDHVNCGEGLFTLFRELKPGTTDALFEGLAPLRMCVMVRPEHVYVGATARVEVALANEDALPPGDYPVQVQITGPDGERMWERTVSVHIGACIGGQEPPLVTPVANELVTIQGPGGSYRCIAALERGGAPTGGETTLHVSDAAAMPPVSGEITRWGEDAKLDRMLSNHGMRVRQIGSGAPLRREVIVVGSKAEPGGVPAFAALAERIARGSTAVFLCPEVFCEGDDAVRWLPLRNKGKLGAISSWLYLKDEWARAHPIFEGLPAGGLMSHPYYRDIISPLVWLDQDAPSMAVAGAIKASQDYQSGLMVAVNDLGAGRFILNTLDIRGQLGSHPAAERLLRNMLRFAASGTDLPPTDPPAGFEATLAEFGYR